MLEGAKTINLKCLACRVAWTRQHRLHSSCSRILQLPRSFPPIPPVLQERRSRPKVTPHSLPGLRLRPHEWVPPQPMHPPELAQVKIALAQAQEGQALVEVSRLRKPDSCRAKEAGGALLRLPANGNITPIPAQAFFEFFELSNDLAWLQWVYPGIALEARDCSDAVVVIV